MKKILLIEDNAPIRENTAELLELAGYKVLAASNGQEGLSMACSELPDLILSDVMMPLMNGHEVFDELQNQESTRRIPFVFLTSSVEKREIQLAFDKGAQGYIKKPFEEQELLETIQNCLKARV